jgi:hypothetical protein
VRPEIGPFESVVLSRVSSWQRTATPSDVARASVSMYRKPRSRIAAKASGEFSA